MSIKWSVLDVGRLNVMMTFIFFFNKIGLFRSKQLNISFMFTLLCDSVLDIPNFFQITWTLADKIVILMFYSHLLWILSSVICMSNIVLLGGGEGEDFWVDCFSIFECMWIFFNALYVTTIVFSWVLFVSTISNLEKFSKTFL